MESSRWFPALGLAGRKTWSVAKLVQRIQAVVRCFRKRAPARKAPAGLLGEGGPRTLAVMGEGADRRALQAAFDERGWAVTFAESTTEALVLQMQERFPIVLFQREVAGRDWRPAVRVLSRMVPRACVVLMSDTSDMNQWEELVRCGGFDVVRTPVDGPAVIRMVGAAWSVWKQQDSQAARPVAELKR